MIETKLISRLRKEGYKFYKLKNGKVYLSKGCPCHSKNKFEVIDLPHD